MGTGIMDEFIWSQKFRPRTIADTVLPKALKATLEGYVKQGSAPNMLFYGKAGIGKTTAAMALLDDIGSEWLLMHGSGDDRGIDAVKTKVPSFASTMSFDRGGRKAIIFDEADNLTGDAQLALRSVIERVSKNCSFILTGNYEGKIIEPLKSRCEPIHFEIPIAERKAIATEIMKRCIYVLNTEGVKYDVEVVKMVVKELFPDFRRILNNLQRYAANGDGSIDSGVMSIVSKSNVIELARIMKDGEWNKMRTWIAQNASDDPASVILNLYTYGDSIFTPEGFANAIGWLNEGQKEMTYVTDRQLSLVNCLTQIMKEATFK
jgi:DNA polymerase III delta prime subunit